MRNRDVTTDRRPSIILHSNYSSKQAIESLQRAARNATRTVRQNLKPVSPNERAKLQTSTNELLRNDLFNRIRKAVEKGSTRIRISEGAKGKIMLQGFNDHGSEVYDDVTALPQHSITISEDDELQDDEMYEDPEEIYDIIRNSSLCDVQGGFRVEVEDNPQPQTQDSHNDLLHNHQDQIYCKTSL